MRRLRFVPIVGCVFCAALAAYPMLPQDTGAAGAWQRLQKLQTTASVMHTTAHPDDEHGGVLTQLSRGRGARVSLLTLTRGESGDNAIGPELFDAVGLIRTEELLDAGRYYGVDAQYFTTMVDYGFSKRLEEALVKWGRENVLREVVRIIRIDRPFVVVSRFQGNDRDGHGNHQAAGLITQEAFRAAGDPSVFPGADPRRCARVAAAEAVHRRRARERRLDPCGRRERVQPVARRVVSGVRAHWPGVSAIAERRRHRAARIRARLLQTARGRAALSCEGGPGEGSELLRRHRHQHCWTLRRIGTRGAARRTRPPRGRGRRGASGNRCVFDADAVGSGACARARPGGDPARDSRARGGARRRIRPEDQGAAVRRRDQRGR